jgi:hypothetical protein
MPQGHPNKKNCPEVHFLENKFTEWLILVKFKHKSSNRNNQAPASAQSWMETS